MTTAYEIASHIRSRHEFSGEIQMHKLLYYAQAWSLAWDGVPLFDGRIEAWKNGPVVPSLRHTTAMADEDVRLTDQQKASIDAVLAHYADNSGTALGELSHGERPWQEARGDCAPGENCSAPITHDSMRRAYSAQSMAGVGPRRVAVPSGRQVADMDDVLSGCAAATKRWERALTLLAQ